MQSISAALGWFSKLVTITVDFDHPMGVDHGQEYVVPWDSFSGTVPLVNLHGSVSGRITLVVADGVRVSYTALVVAIDQYIHFLDPFVSSDMCTR